MHSGAGLEDLAAGTNKDGQVSHREILSYVSDKLGEIYNKDRRNPNERQEPFSQTDFEDQAIFK